MSAVATEISAEDMPDLLTIDEGLATIAASDSPEFRDFVSDGSGPKMDFETGWNSGILDRPMDDLVPVQMKFQDETFPMTRAALQELTSQVGLLKNYVAKTPDSLVSPHIDYWMKNMDNKHRVLIEDGAIVSLCKPSKHDPFPSLPLAEGVVSAMSEKLGVDVSELKVDYKLSADRDRVAARFVAPVQKTIQSSRGGLSVADDWSVGIQLMTSLSGATRLSLSGYLFAWWCTNGATTTHAETTKFTKRADGTDLVDALEWTEGSVDAVLDGIGHELEAVAELTEVSVKGDLSQVMHEVFAQTPTPVNLRENVLMNVAEMEDMTAYGLMNAVTVGANRLDMEDRHRQLLMGMGGDMTRLFGDRCSSCHRLPVL